MPLLSEDLLLDSAVLLSPLDDVLGLDTVVPPPTYQFVLTDLMGNVISDLPAAGGKTVAFSVGSIGTANFTVRLDHDDAEFLQQGDSLLKVYEVLPIPGVNSHRLMFHGRQVTIEENASAQAATLTCGYADPGWFLARRYVGKATIGYARGDALHQVGREIIVGELLDQLNAESTTRLAKGTMLPSGVTYVSGWSYKPMMEALTDLSVGSDAPEWRVRPTEWTDGYIGALDVGPTLGQFRPDAIFEYGDGMFNVTAHKRGGTLEGAANRAFSIPPTSTDSPAQAVLMQQNDVSLGQRELMETVLTSDLTVDELRRQLLLNHVMVRGGMRQTIELTVARDLGDGQVPRLGIDYDTGDLVPYRMSVEMRDENGGKFREKRLDLILRIYGVTLTIDDEGAATPALTTSPTG